MSYKYVIKQGGVQVYSSTTNSNEFTYDFPKNAGDASIVYTIDVEDDNGCTATTASVTVPSGSECKSEESSIYVKLVEDNICDYYEFYSDDVEFYLNVEFANEQKVRYNLKEAGIYDYIHGPTSGAKLVAPEGCNFQDTYDIYLDWVNSCRGLYFVEDPFETLFGDCIFNVSQGKIPLTAHCEYVSSKIIRQGESAALDMAVKIVIDDICGGHLSNVTSEENEIIINGNVTLEFTPSKTNYEIMYKTYPVTYHYKKMPEGYEGDDVEDDVRWSFTLSKGKEITFKQKQIVSTLPASDAGYNYYYYSITPISFELKGISINSDCCQRMCSIDGWSGKWHFNIGNHDQSELERP